MRGPAQNGLEKSHDEDNYTGEGSGCGGTEGILIATSYGGGGSRGTPQIHMSSASVWLSAASEKVSNSVRILFFLFLFDHWIVFFFYIFYQLRFPNWLSQTRVRINRNPRAGIFPATASIIRVDQSTFDLCNGLQSCSARTVDVIPCLCHKFHSSVPPWRMMFFRIESLDPLYNFAEHPESQKSFGLPKELDRSSGLPVHSLLQWTNGLKLCPLFLNCGWKLVCYFLLQNASLLRTLSQKKGSKMSVLNSLAGVNDFSLPVFLCWGCVLRSAYCA